MFDKFELHVNGLRLIFSLVVKSIRRHLSTEKAKIHTFQSGFSQVDSNSFKFILISKRISIALREVSIKIQRPDVDLVYYNDGYELPPK